MPAYGVTRGIFSSFFFFSSLPFVSDLPILVCVFADSMDGCSTDCNGNGECVAGHCHCFAGFLGPDCAKGKRSLSSNEAAIV